MMKQSKFKVKIYSDILFTTFTFSVNAVSEVEAKQRGSFRLKKIESIATPEMIEEAKERKTANRMFNDMKALALLDKIEKLLNK